MHVQHLQSWLGLIAGVGPASHVLLGLSIWPAHWIQIAEEALSQQAGVKMLISLDCYKSDLEMPCNARSYVERERA